MTSIAAPQSDVAVGSHGSRFAKAATSWSPITAAIVGALVAGLFAVGSDILKTRSQDREKRLALETTLASDMNRSFTTAIGAGRRIGTGLVFAPTADPRANRATIQGEFNRGLGQWLVNRGRVRAELF